MISMDRPRPSKRPKLLQTNARCERHRRERIAAALARLHRALPSFQPGAPAPSKHLLLSEAAEQLRLLRDRPDVATVHTGRRLAELERQVAALQRRNSELSGQLSRWRSGARSHPRRRPLPPSEPPATGNVSAAAESSPTASWEPAPPPLVPPAAASSSQTSGSSTIGAPARCPDAAAAPSVAVWEPAPLLGSSAGGTAMVVQRLTAASVQHPLLSTAAVHPLTSAPVTQLTSAIVQPLPSAPVYPVTLLAGSSGSAIQQVLLLTSRPLQRILPRPPSMTSSAIALAPSASQSGGSPSAGSTRLTTVQCQRPCSPLASAVRLLDGELAAPSVTDFTGPADAAPDSGAGGDDPASASVDSGEWRCPSPAEAEAPSPAAPIVPAQTRLSAPTPASSHIASSADSPSAVYVSPAVSSQAPRTSSGSLLPSHALPTLSGVSPLPPPSPERSLRPRVAFFWGRSGRLLSQNWHRPHSVPFYCRARLAQRRRTVAVSQSATAVSGRGQSVLNRVIDNQSVISTTSAYQSVVTAACVNQSATELKLHGADINQSDSAIRQSRGANSDTAGREVSEIDQSSAVPVSSPGRDGDSKAPAVACSVPSSVIDLVLANCPNMTSLLKPPAGDDSVSSCSETPLAPVSDISEVTGNPTTTTTTPRAACGTTTPPSAAVTAAGPPPSQLTAESGLPAPPIGKSVRSGAGTRPAAGDLSASVVRRSSRLAAGSEQSPMATPLPRVSSDGPSRPGGELGSPGGVLDSSSEGLSSPVAGLSSSGGGISAGATAPVSAFDSAPGSPPILAGANGVAGTLVPSSSGSGSGPAAGTVVPAPTRTGPARSVRRTGALCADESGPKSREIVHSDVTAAQPSVAARVSGAPQPGSSSRLISTLQSTPGQVNPASARRQVSSWPTPVSSDEAASGTAPAALSSGANTTSSGQASLLHLETVSVERRGPPEPSTSSSTSSTCRESPVVTRLPSSQSLPNSEAAERSSHRPSAQACGSRIGFSGGYQPYAVDSGRSSSAQTHTRVTNASYDRTSNVQKLVTTTGATPAQTMAITQSQSAVQKVAIAQTAADRRPPATGVPRPEVAPSVTTCAASVAATTSAVQSSIYTLAGAPRRSSVFCIDVLCSKESVGQTAPPSIPAPAKLSVSVVPSAVVGSLGSGSVTMSGDDTGPGGRLPSLVEMPSPAPVADKAPVQTAQVSDAAATAAVSSGAVPARGASNTARIAYRDASTIAFSSANSMIGDVPVTVVTAVPSSMASSVGSRSDYNASTNIPANVSSTAVKSSRHTASSGFISTIINASSSSVTVAAPAADIGSAAGVAAAVSAGSGALRGRSVESLPSTGVTAAPVLVSSAAAGIVTSDRHQTAPSASRRGSCEWGESAAVRVPSGSHIPCVAGAAQLYTTRPSEPQPCAPAAPAPAQRLAASPGRALPQRPRSPHSGAPTPSLGSASYRDVTAAGAGGVRSSAAYDASAMVAPPPAAAVDTSLGGSMQRQQQRLCPRQPPAPPVQYQTPATYQFAGTASQQAELPRQPGPLLPAGVPHATAAPGKPLSDPSKAVYTACPDRTAYGQMRPPPFYHCTSQVPNQTFYASQAMYEPQYQPEEGYWSAAPQQMDPRLLPPAGVTANHKFSGRLPQQMPPPPQAAQYPIPPFYQRPFETQPAMKPAYYKPALLHQGHQKEAAVAAAAGQRVSGVGPGHLQPEPPRARRQEDRLPQQRQQQQQRQPQQQQQQQQQQRQRPQQQRGVDGKELAQTQSLTAAAVLQRPAQQQQQPPQNQQQLHQQQPQQHQLQQHQGALPQQVSGLGGSPAVCTQSLFSVHHLVSSQQKKEPPRKDLPANPTSKRKPDKKPTARAAAARKSKSSYSAEALLAPSELQRGDELSELCLMGGYNPQYLQPPQAGSWGHRPAPPPPPPPPLLPPGSVPQTPCQPAEPVARSGRKERSPGKATLEARRLDDLLLSSSLFECQGALLPAATYTPPADEASFLGSLFSRGDPSLPAAPAPAPGAAPMREQPAVVRRQEERAPEPVETRAQCELWPPAGGGALTSFSLSNLLPEIGSKASSVPYPSGTGSTPTVTRAALLGGEVRNLTTPDLPAHLLSSSQVGLVAPLPPFSSAAALPPMHNLGMSAHQ